MTACMATKCAKIAEFSVKVLVPPLVCSQCAPVEIYCGLRLCSNCIGKVRPKDVLTEEMRAQVAMLMVSQGDALPDFINTKLQIISSDDVQLLMLEAKDATIH